MFGFIKNWLKKQDRIVYIRIRNNVIKLYHYPQGIAYEDEAILAVKKRGKESVVSAVGKAVYDLKEEDTSVIYTPFKPFDLEPENFNLAEKLIRAQLIATGARKSLIAPRLIIHPDKTYVSAMEEQAYKELALSAGAREAVVYVGKKLEPDEIEAVMQNG